MTDSTQDAAQGGYAIRTPETWTLIKTAYLEGESADALADRYGVSVSAVRTRARNEGWRRSDQPDPASEPADAPLTDDDPLLPCEEVASLARRRAIRAVRQGRVAEAERWTRVAAAWARMEPSAAAEKHADYRMELDEIRLLARTSEAAGRMDGRLADRMLRDLEARVAYHFPARRPAPTDQNLHGLHGLHGANLAAVQSAGPAASGPVSTRNR